MHYAKCFALISGRVSCRTVAWASPLNWLLLATGQSWWMVFIPSELSSVYGGALRDQGLSRQALSDSQLSSFAKDPAWCPIWLKRMIPVERSQDSVYPWDAKMSLPTSTYSRFYFAWKARFWFAKLYEMLSKEPAKELRIYPLSLSFNEMKESTFCVWRALCS